MSKTRQYFTSLRMCKKCYFDMTHVAKLFKPGKAFHCPNCGSQDRTKFKRSK